MAADGRRFYVAMAVLATVGFGLLQGARLVDSNSGPYSAQPLALLGLVVDGFSFLSVALLSYFGKMEDWRPLFYIGACSSATHVVLSAVALESSTLVIFVQIVAGLAWSMNILCWMSVFVSFGSRHALIMISLAYAINVAVHPLAKAFGRYSDAVLAVLFVASVLLLAVCLAKTRQIASVVQTRKKEVQIHPSTSIEEAFSRTRRAIAATFVLSAVCGFVIQYDLMNGLEYAQTNETACIGFVMAIAMTVFLAAFRIEKANLDYVCPVSALVVATALLARSMGLVSDVFAGSVMTASLITFYVLLWLMFISEARERMLPAFFLLGLALGVARLSVASGRALAIEVQGRIGLEMGDVAIAGLWVLVVSVSLIYLAYLRYALINIRHGFDVAEEAPSIETVPIEKEEHVATQLSSGYSVEENGQEVWPIDRLAETCGLSKRETEVIREYAAGRSARYIADVFMLSEYTVKTHLRRAYAKIGVHSRQELLDRAEEVEARMRQ